MMIDINFIDLKPFKSISEMFFIKIFTKRFDRNSSLTHKDIILKYSYKYNKRIKLFDLYQLTKKINIKDVFK